MYKNITNDVMNRDILGRSTWYYMHTLAHSCITKNDVFSFKSTCWNILQTYPCEECRYNIQKFHSHRLNELNMLRSVYDCKLWVYFLHADVSEKLGKRPFLGTRGGHAYTNEDIIEILDSMYSQCNH